MTTELRWTELSHGDSYILGERSYGVLFKPALRASQFVDEVIAVEPEPTNLIHLQENIGLNDIENVTIVKGAAVDGDSRTVLLGLGKTFSYTHKTGYTRGRKHIHVDGFNINDLVRHFRINKIKMDVEGDEYRLLQELDFDPIEEIIFEYHFTLIPDPNWTKLYQILNLIEDAGFIILRKPKDLTTPTKRWTAIVWAIKSEGTNVPS